MRNPIQLITSSIAAIRKHPRLLLGIFVIPTIASVAAEFTKPDTIIPTATESGIYFAASLASFALSLLASAAAAYAFDDQHISLKEAYRRATKIFWKYLGLVIVASILVMLATIFFIIPGIIVGVWFSLGTYILVLERRGIVDALKRSREYVRGRWWMVAWRMLSSILIGIAMLLGLIAIMIIGALLSVIEPLSLAFMVFATIPLVVIASAITMGYFYFMYQDVKALYEKTATHKELQESSHA